MAFGLKQHLQKEILQIKCKLYIMGRTKKSVLSKIFSLTSLLCFTIILIILVLVNTSYKIPFLSDLISPVKNIITGKTDDISSNNDSDNGMTNNSNNDDGEISDNETSNFCPPQRKPPCGDDYIEVKNSKDENCCLFYEEIVDRKAEELATFQAAGTVAELLFGVGKGAKAILEKAGKEASEKVIAEAAEKAGKEAGEKAAKEIVEKITNEGLEDAAQEVVEKAAKEAGEKAYQEVIETSGKEAAEKASREAAEKATKEATEKAIQEAAEKAAKEAAEKAAKEAAEKAAKEVAEKTARETAGKVRQKVIKSGTKIMGKVGNKLVGKTASKALAKLAMKVALGPIGWALAVADFGSIVLDFVDPNNYGTITFKQFMKEKAKSLDKIFKSTLKNEGVTDYQANLMDGLDNFEELYNEITTPYINAKLKEHLVDDLSFIIGEANNIISTVSSATQIQHSDYFIQTFAKQMYPDTLTISKQELQVSIDILLKNESDFLLVNKPLLNFLANSDNGEEVTDIFF